MTPNSSAAGCAPCGSQSKNRSLSRYDGRGQGEGQRGHGQVQPRRRSAGQADERGDGRRDHRPQQGEREVEAPLRGRLAATAAPMAKNATWASDTCPAHPVSTTTDRPSVA